MNSHRKIIAAGTLGLLLGGVVGWQAHHLRPREAANPHATAPVNTRAGLPDLAHKKEAKGQTGGTSGGKQSAALQETIKQAYSMVVVGEGRKKLFTTEQFADYLQRHQRDAKSLLVVYRITQDEALLREAYEKNPENPKVASQVVQSLKLPLEEKLALLEKVRQANPKDALTDFLTCGTLIKEGKAAEALRYLQDGLAKPSLDVGFFSQALDAREALMAAGKSPTEARVLSFWYSGDTPPEFIQTSQIGSEEVKKLMAEGREEEAFALAGSLLGLGRHLEHSFGKTAMGEVYGYAFKNNALEALPKDVEIGDTGKTAEELFDLNREEISAFTAEAKGFNERTTWHLQNMDDAGVDLYFQIYEERGERAALEWADAYHGPAPASTK